MCTRIRWRGRRIDEGAGKKAEKTKRMQKVAAFIFSGVQSSFSSRLIWDRDLGWDQQVTYFRMLHSQSFTLNQTNRIQCQCAKEQARRGEGGGERKSQNLCSGINKWDAFLGIDLFGPNPQQTHHHRETLH